MKTLYIVQTPRTLHTMKHRKIQPQYSKTWSPPPPPNDPCLSETAFSHRVQNNIYIHISPEGTAFWRMGPKIQKTWEKCQNLWSWHIMNCP